MNICATFTNTDDNVLWITLPLFRPPFATCRHFHGCANASNIVTKDQLFVLSSTSLQSNGSLYLSLSRVLNVEKRKTHHKFYGNNVLSNRHWQPVFPNRFQELFRVLHNWLLFFICTLFWCNFSSVMPFLVLSVGLFTGITYSTYSSTSLSKPNILLGSHTNSLQE